jgi:hypothetical protein
MDPDDGEILYSYASAGEYGDYTSPASNGAYSWNYQVYAAIGNAANVTVTLSNLQYDTSVINSNTTFSVIKGSNQKDINKSIDNKLKPYPTTNSGNVYSVSSLDIDTLTDGYPILVRFNADSTEDISLKVNNSSAYDVVDYFNNKVSNIRNGLIAHLIFDATNGNFQLLCKGGDGDATPDVLVSPYTAITKTGPISGTLADNYNTDNIECTPTVSGTTLKLTIPTTARYKQGNHLQVTDPDFTASNIPIGKNLFGLDGSYDPLTLVVGDSAIYNDATELDDNTHNSGYVLGKACTCYNHGGTIRVKYDTRVSSTSETIHSQLYVNGSPRGTARTNTSTTYVTYTEDITVNVGDVVQIYFYIQTTTYHGYIANFKICCGNNYGIFS